MTTRPSLLVSLALSLIAGCGTVRTHTPPHTPETAPARNTTQNNAAAPARVSPTQRLAREQLRAQLPAAGSVNANSFLQQHRVSFTPSTAFNPSQIAGFDTIQRSPYSLNESERRQASEHGFSLLPRHRFPNFMSGYAMLYLADQPIYISADAILNAMHASFDTMVADIESDALAPAITTALQSLRTELTGANGARLSAETRADLDGYLAISLGLLTDRSVAPVAGANAAEIEQLRTAARQGSGTSRATLFGANRDVDFSQFQPRGHYAGVPELERYFRAVMWLGREGLRLVDTEHGERVLRRRQINAAVALWNLASPTARTALATMEQAISSFAGEPETLTFQDVGTLAAELTRAGGVDRLSDAQLLQAIDTIRGDRPRIATTLLHHPAHLEHPAPEPVGFSLTPQRYTPDSLVLSRVTYDRIPLRRMMPEPLDAAFGALGNDQAAALLEPSLRTIDYASELLSARVLIDAHESSFWNGSMYASWIQAVRMLSPRETLNDRTNLPSVMTTEAWGRRILNTQMAAWAEIRHDMVLYAAESYSAVPGCSYPAGYVEPYPAFWSALDRWVGRAQQLVANTAWTTAEKRTRWTRWSNHAHTVVQRLTAMAERERQGQELTPEQLAYLNQAVNTREIDAVCTRIVSVDAGWLYELYEPRLQLGEHRNIVAGVHTQPADAEGNTVGHVLHIGTADPQTMVVFAGPPGHMRAYLGLASTYLERTTRNFERLTDQRWQEELSQARSPSWLSPILPR